MAFLVGPINNKWWWKYQFTAYLYSSAVHTDVIHPLQ